MFLCIDTFVKGYFGTWDVLYEKCSSTKIDVQLNCAPDKEGRKEMFYLTTHSTHFIYGYMASDIIMVKDHSDSERGNLLPPHGLLFPK